MRRVVVTGIGTVSPCGLDAETTWRAVTAGNSGIGPITRFDTTDFPTKIAGECTGFDPEKWTEKKRLRESDRFIHLAIAASAMALKDGKYEPNEEERHRTGTFIGVGFCGLEIFEDTAHVLFERGPRRITPYFIPAVVPNLAPGQVSMRFGLKGPSFCTASACASGANAIGEAFRWIQRGDMYAALTGGTEAAVTPLGIGGFSALRALSKRNDEPTKASRPFDKGRDGFVLSEGAAIILLEERERALRRGATIYAEIVGYGATADAYHLTQPAPNGEGARHAMKQALDDAKMPYDKVDYINAHGTSTETGDIQELVALKALFGDHAKNGLMVSSTKSMTGHLLGASGGLEALLSVLAIHHGLVPPTINLDDPIDEAEGIDLVPGKARQAPITVAMSNSFGFGGANVSLVFKHHD